MRILQIDLNRDYEEVLQQSIAVLKQGGIIVYPTDTVYGIGGNALDEFAVRRIFEIKQRSSKPLPIIARNMTWVEELAYLTDDHRRLAQKFWPGKFTLVLPKKEIIPPIVTTGLSGVGIRIPDHKFTNKILEMFGYPLVATSANISGNPATGNINDIIKQFENAPSRPDLIIDAGVLPPANPSVVIDCTTDKPKVLRIGPSKPGDFLKLLEI